MKLVCDPDLGWLYGFPREVPTKFVVEGGGRVADDKWEDFKEWVTTECKGNEPYSIRYWTVED